MTDVRTPRHGRSFDEFEIGAVYQHPWDVTLDTGMTALFRASFLDATPTYSSATFARALGFRDVPIPPLLLLNLGLAFSVHDVSEQAIAHLAYLDVRFPHPCYAGDTVRACSMVLGVSRARDGDRGVVHVQTVVRTEDARIVCQFERKVLVGGGERRPMPVASAPTCLTESSRRWPSVLDHVQGAHALPTGFAGFFEDFVEGDVICHAAGRTVSEAEHMQLATLCRNTHPLHTEEPFARSGFANTRVVYGGLVFAWIAALASRDTTGNVLWDVAFDHGAHPAGVVAGDTLYAASRVMSRESVSEALGRVTLRLVGTKNVKPAVLLDAGADLFTDERTKAADERAPAKVFEVERTVLMRKRR